MPTARRRSPAAALVTAALLVLAPACGGDDDGPAASSTSTTRPPTTPTTLTPEDEVEAVYLEFVDVVVRLVTTDPDPHDAELLRLAGDPLLAKLQDNITTLRAENQIVQTGARTTHWVQSVDITGPSSAVVQACDVADDKTIDLDDNSIVAEGLVTRVLEASLTLDGDTWKVTRLDTIERFSGEVPCPE